MDCHLHCLSTTCMVLFLDFSTMLRHSYPTICVIMAIHLDLALQIFVWQERFITETSQNIEAQLDNKGSKHTMLYSYLEYLIWAADFKSKFNRSMRGKWRHSTTAAHFCGFSDVQMFFCRTLTYFCLSAPEFWLQTLLPSFHENIRTPFYNTGHSHMRWFLPPSKQSVKVLKKFSVG